MSSSSAIVDNAIGGVIASEVHGVIGILVSRITAEIKLAWGLKKELGELAKKLQELGVILEGSSHEPITNRLMAIWLNKIKDAVEDADFLLDECFYDALKVKNQTRKRDKIKNKVTNIFSHHLGMAHKVEDITNLIGNIYNDAHKHGIKPVKVAAGHLYPVVSDHVQRQHMNLRNQRHIVDDKFLVGRDCDIAHLVGLLRDSSHSNSDLSVVGIVGLGGLGKTALSKCVSKAREVTESFNFIIWLVVSHSYELVNMLNRMVEKLFEQASNMKDEQALIWKLKSKLKKKKYLLILDDVWDTISWESLKNTLEDIGGCHGTTILVTSRERHVVEKMVTYSIGSDGKQTRKKPYIHPLQGLSEDYSWSLFVSRISDGSLIGSEKRIIARRMITNCGGVPLAIRALGNLLSNQSSLTRWKEIEKRHSGNKVVDNDDILPSLRLSYDYLPSTALKKCFAYCAIFREDEVIQKDHLIYMWMAQGLLQPYDEMERIGEEYIEHLLNSSLFQEANMDPRGKVRTFKMHDLVRTLACDVSKGECLCLEKYVETSEHRHFLIPNSFERSEITFKSYPKLQTCVVVKKLVLSGLQSLLECKHLKVLHMGQNWDENLDWKPLGCLIHLRYFGISVWFNDEHSFMKSNIGDQITKLYHLQTLYIDCNFAVFEEDERPVAHFLKEMGRMVNLRHILIDLDIGIPVDLRRLTALQSLPVIDVGLNWGGQISDVGLMTNLRGKLEIHRLELLTLEEACNLDLGRKSNLESLILKWRHFDSQHDEKNPHANEILDALKPNANLGKLKVEYYNGTAFPTWLSGGGSRLSNLISLEIESCDAAGNLKLENFTCLNILHVEGCMKLKVTLPNNNCIPLKKLYVESCYGVKGLAHLSLLRQLQDIHIWTSIYRMGDDVLVGLDSLASLRELKTDLILPEELREDSPVCKSLKKLTLMESRYGDTSDLPESMKLGDTSDLPKQLQHLVALRSLDIRQFGSVEAIPNWLGNLTSLRELDLSGMPKLKHLPSQDVMIGLDKLRTFSCLGCPLLQEDFKNKTGEWSKIARIPHKTLQPPWL